MRNLTRPFFNFWSFTRAHKLHASHLNVQQYVQNDMQMFERRWYKLNMNYRKKSLEHRSKSSSFKF